MSQNILDGNADVFLDGTDKPADFGGHIASLAKEDGVIDQSTAYVPFYAFVINKANAKNSVLAEADVLKCCFNTTTKIYAYIKNKYY